MAVLNGAEKVWFPADAPIMHPGAATTAGGVEQTGGGWGRGGGDFAWGLHVPSNSGPVRNMQHSQAGGEKAVFFLEVQALRWQMAVLIGADREEINSSCKAKEEALVQN